MIVEYYQAYTSPLQQKIMLCVSQWAHSKSKPIPQRIIVSTLRKERIPITTIKAAVRVLERRGYIRKAVQYQERVAYVQIHW